MCGKVGFGDQGRVGHGFFSGFVEMEWLTIRQRDWNQINHQSFRTLFSINLSTKKIQSHTRTLKFVIMQIHTKSPYPSKDPEILPFLSVMWWKSRNQLLIRDSSTELKITALNSLASLLKLDNQHQTADMINITQTWYNQIPNMAPTLINVVKQPFLDLRWYLKGSIMQNEYFRTIMIS